MLCDECGYDNPATERYCRNCEHDLRDIFAPDDHDGVLIFAGFWVRFIAVLLDILLMLACLVLFAILTIGVIALSGRESFLHDSSVTTIFYWTLLLASLAYHVLMESGTGGATLGKRWMNLKVVDNAGQRLTPLRALARAVARLFSFPLLFAGFLLQPFTQNRQTLHDLVAGTLVIQASATRKISVMASLLVLLSTLLVPTITLFATAGLPVFQQYILKVQLENGMKTGQQATQAVARHYLANGIVPQDISTADPSLKPTYFISQIALNPLNGEVSLTYSDKVSKAVRGKHLLFTPGITAERAILWKCHSDDIEMRLLPPGCK